MPLPTGTPLHWIRGGDVGIQLFLLHVLKCFSSLSCICSFCFSDSPRLNFSRLPAVLSLNQLASWLPPMRACFNFLWTAKSVITVYLHSSHFFSAFVSSVSYLFTSGCISPSPLEILPFHLRAVFRGRYSKHLSSTSHALLAVQPVLRESCHLFRLLSGRKKSKCRACGREAENDKAGARMDQLTDAYKDRPFWSSLCVEEVGS